MKEEVGEIACRKCGSFNIRMLDTKRVGNRISRSYRCSTCENFWVSKIYLKEKDSEEGKYAIKHKL